MLENNPDYAISIHAPVKGATGLFCRKNVQRHISIHAPVKGATNGCRGFILSPVISIHAPVKGATSLKTVPGSGMKYFNPRSREGSDARELLSYGIDYGFQSTLP